ncbi:MAG: PAS domain-containing protein [Methylocystis sp.]
MRQQVSKDLFNYWSELKGARAAPDRADIDPMRIRHLLADTFIIEFDPDRSFPLRLSGTRVNALWLREHKGLSFFDFWREEDRRSLRAALLTVVEGVAPIVVGARAEAPGDIPLELELLLLPLRYFGKTHSRVLGALSPAYQPDWLGHLAAGPLELISMRVIEPPTTGSSVLFRRVAPAHPRLRLVASHGISCDVDNTF